MTARDHAPPPRGRGPPARDHAPPARGRRPRESARRRRTGPAPPGLAGNPAAAPAPPRGSVPRRRGLGPLPRGHAGARSPVDSPRPRDEAVGRRTLEQLLEVAASPLSRDRERPVLDEAALVDEVADVLARGAPPSGAAAAHRLGPRVVARQRLALEHLGEVSADRVGVLAGRLGFRLGSRHRRSLARARRGQRRRAASPSLRNSAR